MKDWRGTGARMEFAHQEIADAEREGEMRRLRQQSEADPEAPAGVAPVADHRGLRDRLRRLLRRAG